MTPDMAPMKSVKFQFLLGRLKTYAPCFNMEKALDVSIPAR